METNYITLTKENIANEHICCAFSDKKCKDSYETQKRMAEEKSSITAMCSDVLMSGQSVYRIRSC